MCKPPVKRIFWILIPYAFQESTIEVIFFLPYFAGRQKQFK
jgi:hypothetical protein